MKIQRITFNEEELIGRRIKHETMVFLGWFVGVINRKGMELGVGKLNNLIQGKTKIQVYYL